MYEVNVYTTLGLLVAATAVYLVVGWIYVAFFHPLSIYPGPKLYAASAIPYSFHILRGELPFKVLQLHEKYGEVVRISPWELSYNSVQAWHEIYGHVRGDKKLSFQKDPKYWGPNITGHSSLLRSNDVDHRRMRKLANLAFSEKALTAQEPLLQGYARRLIARLTEESTKGSLDIAAWWMYSTFDLIGDLSFGESFDCIQSGKMSKWISMTFNTVKTISFIQTARYFILLEPFVKFLIPKTLQDQRKTHFQWSKAKLDRRLNRDTNRPDFISYFTKMNSEFEFSEDEDKRKGMSQAELLENAITLIIAGSETTATLLTGCTFNLLQNPAVLSKLTNEIRRSFAKAEDMTLNCLSQQVYLTAVLEEGLRIFPPVPTTLPRVVPEPTLICDKFVPKGCSVGINQYACGRGSNFRDPQKFRPERWLGDPHFENDHRASREPFSVGPRNCLGKNMAYAEARLLLANLVWHFDIKDSGQNDGWLERCRIYRLWEKPPLHVHLSPRKPDLL